MIKFTPLMLIECITWNSRKGIKRGLTFANICISSVDFFILKKWVKYTNEMTDDIIHSTQCCTEYINRAILANLQSKPLKLGRLIVLQKTHLWL